MDSSCIHTNGKGLCRKCKILNSFQKSAPKVKLHFHGPSPPEVFVGRIGYPHIQAGILAPPTFDSKHAEFSHAEQWANQNLSIENVLRLRGQLVYGKTMMHVHQNRKYQDVIQELALTHKKTSTEFFLKKPPKLHGLNVSEIVQPMVNPAPLRKVQLEENTKVFRKVDAVVNDSDVRATTAITELQSKVGVHHLQKLLSVGLLGKKDERRMVPTRWSITAVDDVISKEQLKKIRYYQETDKICIFKGSYLGNYIQILIMPGKFSFEAIEVWSEDENEINNLNTSVAKDYESFKGRKTYAKNVTGGYYAMRLPVTEFLDKVKRQAGVLVFREITKEYYAALGVGIVREATRKAFQNEPITFESKENAITFLQTNQMLNHNHLEGSWMLTDYGKQKELKEFF